jgi:hypothetical protein
MYIQKYIKYKDKYLSLKNKLYGGVYNDTYFNDCHTRAEFITKTHKLLINRTCSIIVNSSITNVSQGKEKYKACITQLFFLTSEEHRNLISCIDNYKENGIDNLKQALGTTLSDLETDYTLNIPLNISKSDDKYFINNKQEFPEEINDNSDIISFNDLVEYLQAKYADNDDELNSLDLIQKIRDKIFERQQIILSHRISNRLIISFEFILVHLMSENNMKYYINVILFVLKIIVQKMILIIKKNIMKQIILTEYDIETATSTMLLLCTLGTKYIAKFSQLDDTSLDKIEHLKKIIEQHTYYLSYFKDKESRINILREQIKTICNTFTPFTIYKQIGHIYDLYEKLQYKDFLLSLELIIKSDYKTFLKNLKIYLLRTFQKNIKKLKYDDTLISIYEKIISQLKLLETLFDGLNDIDKNNDISLNELNRIIETSIDTIVKLPIDDEFYVLFTIILDDKSDNIKSKIKHLKKLLNTLLEYKKSELKSEESYIHLPYFKMSLKKILSPYEGILDIDQQFKKHIETILNLLNKDFADETYVNIIIDGILTLIYRVIIAYQNSLKSKKGEKCNQCNICSEPVVCSIDIFDLKDSKVTCSSCREFNTEGKYNGFKCGHIVCNNCVNCTDNECKAIKSFQTEKTSLYEYFFCPLCNNLSYYINYSIDASIHLAICQICSELKEIQGFLRCGHTNICSDCIVTMKKTDQTERETLYREGRLNRLANEIKLIRIKDDGLTKIKNKFLSIWGESLIEIDQGVIDQSDTVPTVIAPTVIAPTVIAPREGEQINTEIVQSTLVPIVPEPRMDNQIPAPTVRRRSNRRLVIPKGQPRIRGSGEQG